AFIQWLNKLNIAIKRKIYRNKPR
ncbi:uncharacterized protein METZ01_LOCUS161819, partial [marine metagenome]